MCPDWHFQREKCCMHHSETASIFLWWLQLALAHIGRASSTAPFSHNVHGHCLLMISFPLEDHLSISASAHAKILALARDLRMCEFNWPSSKAVEIFFSGAPSRSRNSEQSHCAMVCTNNAYSPCTTSLHMKAAVSKLCQQQPLWLVPIPLAAQTRPTVHVFAVSREQQQHASSLIASFL